MTYRIHDNKKEIDFRFLCERKGITCHHNISAVTAVTVVTGDTGVIGVTGVTGGNAHWIGMTSNERATGSFARWFAKFLELLAHLLALHCMLCSRSLLRLLFARSLSHS